jgi:Zn-dependent protease
MWGWSINLFRIRGITISLHWFFLLLLGYYAYDGWAHFGMPGMWWNSAQVLLVFACVVLHELGHSFTAMRFGIGVRRILLTPLGGMAQFDSIPKNPVQELLITVAGPAVNFAIVAALWFFVDFPDGWDVPTGSLTLEDVGRMLFSANLVLGIFNLYPAFPMDGGRILRALLAIRLPYLRATFWAVVISRVLTGIGIVASIYFHDYILTALFLFIMTAGNAEYVMLKRREAQEAQWREMAARHYEVPPAGEPPMLNS